MCDEKKEFIVSIKANDVTVSLEHYTDLKNDQMTLRALEAAGVDNWEGYSHAMEFMSDD